MKKEASLRFHMNMGMLINSAQRAMTKRFVQNATESGLDISLDQWMVLGPIWQLESASQKELGEMCLKDKTNITRIIDALEEKNLVVRVEDQIDHRVKRVACVVYLLVQSIHHRSHPRGSRYFSWYHTI